MWVQAGFQPDSFWDQSPATFQACMIGVRARMTQESEGGVVDAWQTAALSGAAAAGKLKPLNHYLRKQTIQSPAEMLATLRSLNKDGKLMTIRKVSRET